MWVTTRRSSLSLTTIQRWDNGTLALKFGFPHFEKSSHGDRICVLAEPVHRNQKHGRTPGSVARVLGFKSTLSVVLLFRKGTVVWATYSARFVCSANITVRTT